MEYRNAVYNAQGGIDMEVNHPVHGWVPFTASALDPEQAGQDFFEELELADDVGPYVVPVPPTPSTDPDDYPLNKQQWAVLIYSSDLADTLEIVKAALKTADITAFGALMGKLAGDTFLYAETMQMITDFAPFIPAEADLSAGVISPLWISAAQTGAV